MIVKTQRELAMELVGTVDTPAQPECSGQCEAAEKNRTTRLCNAVFIMSACMEAAQQ